MNETVGFGAAEIAERIQQVRQRIADLGGTNVSIIAVTKGFGIAEIRAAMKAGCSMVGENYAQELQAKFAALDPRERPEIHFIGRLQSNKVAGLAPFVNVWQTVDRLSIAQAIVKQAPGARVFIQVNATGEPDKGGCQPHEVAELVVATQELGLEVLGLMTIGPTQDDRALTEAAFRTVALLRNELGLAELSMGMSEDLDIAVPLGTTMVRMGRAIFGERPPKIGV
jgi:pyridoxal phosphate enzyme (YggS family)